LKSGKKKRIAVEESDDDVVFEVLNNPVPNKKQKTVELDFDPRNPASWGPVTGWARFVKNHWPGQLGSLPKRKKDKLAELVKSYLIEHVITNSHCSSVKRQFLLSWLKALKIGKKLVFHWH
jgi:hypothetical protein